MTGRANAAEAAEVEFGNLRTPRPPGLGPLSTGASAALLGGVAVLFVLLIVNFWVALGWAVLLVVAVAPAAVPTRDGYGRYGSMVKRFRFQRAQAAGRTVLVQGMTGAVPDGVCRLPGVGARSELHEFSDVHRRPFGVVSWPQAGLHSIVLRLYPEGVVGLDKEFIDGQVAQWGAWLANLSTYEDIVAASVVVETAPDSGQRLSRALARGRDDAAPEFAKIVTEQIRSEYSQGSPTLKVWVTLTFTAVEAGADARDARDLGEVADEIGDLLPTLTGTLAMTGGGTSARPCTAQEIVDDTRVAFDPSVALLVEDAQADGGTGLSWDDVGPLYARARWDCYEHESGVSRVWQMREPPRGVFYAETLRRLLEPHKHTPRKRVTLLYRPESPQRSAAAAEADVKKAMFVATQRRRATARAGTELEAAQVTARQEAHGSPLIRVGILVSVTVLDPAELRRASRAVMNSLAPPTRLTLRVPRATQDVSFLASLPLGMVPSRHMRIPSDVREAM